MFDRPIIVVGAPRSGTTLLQRCFALHPEIWHLPAESHSILEGPFHPSYTNYNSNRVTEVDDIVAKNLRNAFYKKAINLHKVKSDPTTLLATKNVFSSRIFTRMNVLVLGEISKRHKKEPIRFVEKTPKNSLRIPAMEKIFPDAYYLFLKRDAAITIDSLIAGWYAFDKIGPFSIRKRFATYPIAKQLNLRDYPYKWWNYSLVPQWRELQGKTVADAAAWQYYQCNHYILHDLQAIDKRRVFFVRYEDFVARPVVLLHEVFSWAELSTSPVSQIAALVQPSRDKLRYEQAVYAAMERLPQLTVLEEALKNGVTLS